MRKIIIFTYILLLLSFVTSCSKNDEPVTREQALSKGYAMLDAQQYDEAIQYFSDMVSKDPQYHVKLALASAYAARAGVKIETIYSFVTAKNSPTLNIPLKGVTLDQQARDLLKNLGSAVAAWDKIPTVDAGSRNDLQNAVDVLTGEEVPGVRLYSAALRAVILKSSVQEGLQNWNITSHRQVCVHDVKPYWNWALRVLQGLSDFAGDLEGAFPSKKEISDARAVIENVKAQANALPIPTEDQCF